MASIDVRQIAPGVELWSRGGRRLVVFAEPMTDAGRRAALDNAPGTDWAIEHDDRLYTVRFGQPDKPINIYTLRPAGWRPVGGRGATASALREATRAGRRTSIMETGSGQRFFGAGSYEPIPGTAADRRLKRQVIRERAAEHTGARTITTGGDLVEPRRRRTHRQVWWPGFGG